MQRAARAAALALLCLGAACGESRDSPPGAKTSPAPAIDGRIDPSPYRAQIEATEALLYGADPNEARWKDLSKALLELHNAIVFRDTSPLARETSERLFFFSAQVDAAGAGKHPGDQLAVVRGVWERIRSDRFAAASWFHTATP